MDEGSGALASHKSSDNLSKNGPSTLTHINGPTDDCAFWPSDGDIEADSELWVQSTASPRKRRHSFSCVPRHCSCLRVAAAVLLVAIITIPLNMEHFQASSPESLGVLASPAARAALIASLTSASSSFASRQHPSWTSSQQASPLSSSASPSPLSDPSAASSPGSLSWSSLHQQAGSLLGLSRFFSDARRSTDPSSNGNQAPTPTLNGRTAVCLTGSARDFELTGPSIVARLLPSLRPYRPVLFLVAPLDEHSHKLWALQWGLGTGEKGGVGGKGESGGNVEGNEGKEMRKLGRGGNVNSRESEGGEGQGKNGGKRRRLGETRGGRVGRMLGEEADGENEGEGEVELGAVEMAGSVWVDGEEVVENSMLYNNSTARSMQPQLQYLRLLTSCLSLIEGYQRQNPSAPLFHRIVHSRLDSYWSAPPSFSSAFSPSAFASADASSDSTPAAATVSSAGAGASAAAERVLRETSEGSRKGAEATEGAGEGAEEERQGVERGTKGVKREIEGEGRAREEAERAAEGAAGTGQQELEWAIPFGSDFSGFNDAFGVGSLSAARHILSRFSSLKTLAKTGLSNLSPEATLKAQLEATGVHVARGDWPLCTVSHSTYQHGHGEVLVASLQSPASLNGAKCRPCTPKYTGLEALSHFAWAPPSNWIRSPSASLVNTGEGSIELCDARHPWELAWADNYDAAAGVRLGGMRRAVTSTNLRQCVQLMGQLQNHSTHWIASPPAAMCVRSLLGRISIVGSYGVSFPTALAVITPNSMVLSTSPKSNLPLPAELWESHLLSLLPGLAVHPLASFSLASTDDAAADVVKFSLDGSDLPTLSKQLKNKSLPPACQILLAFPKAHAQKWRAKIIGQLEGLTIHLATCLREPGVDIERCLFFSVRHCTTLLHVEV
ncbi:hypothetical protein CLOM_g4048 [Closterium sp. NIES-68]|nr:hypothetical protein CLOM_g4048 [Closterium sp. NIES-68]GJP62671.1 hypothetical protein CLOP_g19703 [Closterium sp. NIES-67]